MPLKVLSLQRTHMGWWWQWVKERKRTTTRTQEEWESKDKTLLAIFVTAPMAGLLRLLRQQESLFLLWTDTERYPKGFVLLRIEKKTVEREFGGMSFVHFLIPLYGTMRISQIICAGVPSLEYLDMGFINRLMAGSWGIAKSTIPICMKKDDDDQIYRTYFGTEPARLSVGLILQDAARLLFSIPAELKMRNLCVNIIRRQTFPTTVFSVFLPLRHTKSPVRLNLPPLLILYRHMKI